MTWELVMGNESCRESMFQLAGILIVLGESHFPSLIV